MVNFKITIDYNNVLIKAQLNYITTMTCLHKSSERYYVVIALR